jgi:STE24 endopeptidase
VKDQLKKFVVTQAIMLPIVSITIFIVQAGGNYFFVYAWLFMSVAILVSHVSLRIL